MKRLFSLLVALAMLLTLAPVMGVAEAEAPAEFSLYGQADANDGPWADMYMFKKIQEMFNVKLNITEISSSVWDEKIAISFASDDYPDFFLGGLDADDLQTYGSQGILIDLAEYLTPEKTPNIAAIYENYPIVRLAATSYDGHIYAFKGYDKTNTREYLQARFFVNTQWAKNLGIAEPTTLAEFHDFLKAIKDGDPNGNGDTEDEIPLGGAYESDPMSLLTVPLTAYGYALSYGSNQTYVDVKDGKVIFVPTEERFKDALAYMKTLYDEKLLDPEYFTQTAEQQDAKLSEQRVGAFMDWAQWLSITDPAKYAEYDGIVPLTSEYNSTPIWPSTDVQSIGLFAITDKCQNIDKLLEIADWSTTFDAYCTLLGGYEVGTVEGKTDGYTIEYFDESYGENALTLNYTRDESYANDSAWREANIAPGWGWLPVCRIDFTFIESSPTEQALSSALNDNYAPYAKIGWPSSVKFSDEEHDTLSLINTDLESYLDQMVAKFITGEESLDNFGAFIEGCNARGLEQYIQIYQTAYDRYIAQ